MRASIIIQIIGLSGCFPSPTGSQSPPPEPPITNPPAPVEAVDTFTTPDQSQVGELNARSAQYGRVYARGGGQCAVHHPWPEDGIQTSGINLNLVEVDCPEGMADPAHQSCAVGILRRDSETSCACVPVTGNPPPPEKPHPCPG